MTGPARYDAVVIGGGPAGLTAALYLGRSRRRTLLVDAGAPRNAPAAHAQGVYTRDGTPPPLLIQEARRQLGEYREVELRADEAVAARGEKGCFEVELAEGGLVQARRLLIACGVRDALPAIPGVAELWGKRVHPCAYCHGYEERDRPLAVMAEGETALAAVAALLNLSRDIVLCTNGSPLLPEDRARLEAHRVRIVEAPLTRIDTAGDAIVLRFAGGERLYRAALFMKSRPYLASDLPAQLGCRLDGPARIVVGANWETSVPGVHAAGDVAADKKFVVVAAASGAEAAVTIDGGLAQEDFGGEWAGPLCTGGTAAEAVELVEQVAPAALR